MDDFELELKQDFLDESEDMLSNAEGAFLRLESERDNPELLNEIFRIAHNLKGTSKAVGFDQMSELTHTAENLILAIQQANVEATDSVVSILLHFNDEVVKMIAGLKEDIERVFDISEIQEKLKAALNGETLVEQEEACGPEAQLEEKEPQEEVIVAEESSSTTEISEAALESMREAGIDISGLVSQDSQPPAADDVRFENEPDPKPEPAPAAQEKKEEPKKEVVQKKSPAKVDESIRVSLGKIEDLNNIVGELVILQTVLEQRRYVNCGDALINKSIGQLGKLSKEIQEISMSLRMVPLKSTFQKMSRIVRDTSKTLNKKVNLHLIGEDTEVDKTVLEQLSDPLVHIIRNAIDHGLETPEDRVQAGKEETGTVELMAYHEGSNLVIQITDDGNGINPDIIRKKAIEKKLIDPNATISDHEMIQYIFHPGFSTKEVVSEVSGRGVGMDVVKTNIENLSGEVKLVSKLGSGSSFKIVLPLTLAIIDGMITQCGKDRFIIPVSQVHELIKSTEKNVYHINGLGDCLRLRGQVIPIFSLAKQFGKAELDNPNKILMVFKTNQNFTFAIQVDDVTNQQQVVIKTIGEEIRNRKGIMGSSILGDGKPAFIIDSIELFSDQLKQNSKFKELSNRLAS